MKLTSYGSDTSQPSYSGHGTQMSPGDPGPLRTSYVVQSVRPGTKTEIHRDPARAT